VQGNRKVGEMFAISLLLNFTDPIPDPAPREGKGARRAGRGVNNVKIVETIRMFDFAIALAIRAMKA